MKKKIHTEKKRKTILTEIELINFVNFFVDDLKYFKLQTF